MLPAVFLVAQPAALAFLDNLCSLLPAVLISYLYYIFHFGTPSVSKNSYPCAIDSKGDVRWLINVAMQWQMKPLKNGRWLCGTERQLVQPYYVTGLYEMDLTGRIYKEYYVPGGYHHAFIEMEDGNLLVATDDLAHGWLEDTVVLLDRKTGEILKTWDLKNIMTPGDGKGSKYLPDDWFHNNALQYDKQTNAIILSGRHVDSIISIDYDSGKLNWILGDPDGWSEDKQKYFFKPIGDDFEWPYAPHSCVMTDSNNVYCFDNGCARSKNPAKYRKNGDNYSRGVHYQIDTEKMEIRQVWQYGKERGSDFFSMYISNVFPYTDNHVLVHSGGIGYFEGKPWEKEYVPVLIKNPETEPYAITVELVDDKVVYELKQRGNYYRALRMPMYKEGYHLEMSVSEVLGCLNATLEESMPIAETMNALPPEEVRTEVIEEEDRMTIRCFLKLGTEAGLLLEQGEERHYYKIETNLRPLVRLIQSGGEVAEGYSVMILAITKTGLRGDYSVKFLADGKVYDTNVKIKGATAQ